MNKEFKKDISVIIPCFNESEGLAQLGSKLKALEAKLGMSYELVFVDDGSSDSTGDKLKELYQKRLGRDAKVIIHPKNRGVGGAIKTGVKNSDGRYIAAMDSDCTYEPTHLADMLMLMKEKNADIITASPYHPKGSTRGVPGYRLFLSRGLSILYNIVSGSKFYTYTSMFRIYRSEAVKNIDFKSEGFLSMAEILIKAHKKGLRILEYPATLTGRTFGVSNAKTLKIIKEHLGFIGKLLMGKV